MHILTKEEEILQEKYKEDFSRMMNFRHVIHCDPGRASPFYCSYCLRYYNRGDIGTIRWLTVEGVTRLYSWECPICETVMFPRFVTQREREQVMKKEN
ncbi:hypothetical protein KAR91_84430 [Candidatus Pacearchaeota archaeon]|nr:hypothetical protein [Candidatus Pacearchaeota archaeon]